MSAQLALQGTCFLSLLNERSTSESAFSLDEKVRAIGLSITRRCWLLKRFHLPI
jgi:hypothetical protein